MSLAVAGARVFAACLLAAGLMLAGGCRRTPPRTVVLIGGTASEGPGRHAYPQGIRALQALLQQDPGSRDRREPHRSRESTFPT